MKKVPCSGCNISEPRFDFTWKDVAYVVFLLFFAASGFWILFTQLMFGGVR